MNHNLLIIGESKKYKEIINRDKGQTIIYNVLKEGQELIRDNPNLKMQYEQNTYNNIKITNININNFSIKIEQNLFLLYKNNSNAYLNFLQEFSKLKKYSKDLLIKIILGYYTPENISNFKGDDFLSEEKRKEKEIKKKKELEKMKIKQETYDIKFSLSKGNLLTEKEIFKENENDNNINENILININNKNKERLILKQKEFPKLKPQDIKTLIDLEYPSRDNIKERLESILKKNLDFDSANRFLEIRKNILNKKAKFMMKKDKDILENKNDNIYIDNKVNEYIKNISFGDLKILN